jgi:carboxynorspermidine decarboxylase
MRRFAMTTFGHGRLERTTTTRASSVALDERMRSLQDMRRVAELVDTPAFVIDEKRIRKSARVVERIRKQSGSRVLYALKPLCDIHALRWLAPHVDGFAASSLFEAKLAREVLADHGTVHITTPAFRPDEIEEIGRICDFVAFNSLSQYHRFHEIVEADMSVGLRINPQLGFVDDDRYNPCRPHSKLGVPLEALVRSWRRGSLSKLDGIHFHTNCDSSTFAPLKETVEHITARLGGLLERVQWFNLGGGYLLDSPDALGDLYQAIDALHSRFGVEVFFEPGAALVRSAGFLVASVIDLFSSDGQRIAVLDTTVNHMPEVFEYQFEPDVLGDRIDGENEYLLVGGTCLAGDLFGVYGFDEPLEIGSRVIFPDFGAYTTVKAHMFNGINLPTCYALDASGQLELTRRYTYRDFVARCGVENHAAV